jgi:UPF0042 nucleotide-binding protein
MKASEPLRVVLVTGLSGGGKASVLHALEDIGYEAVDNPPLQMLEEMVSRSERRLAIGVDARTRGFDANAVLQALQRLRLNPNLHPQLVYAWADETTLLRRYTESRRRHPLAPEGRVADGIAAEQELTAALHGAADLVIDTTDLPIPGLRRLVERHFGTGDEDGGRRVITLVSFAYNRGLPREADLVFDARFLRNPHYDPILQPRTGLDLEVGAYVEADPDFGVFFGKVKELVQLLLPRFVQEGKKYVTIAFGCTGGRHRSVYLVESLAAHLASWLGSVDSGSDLAVGWRLCVVHRDLARDGRDHAYLAERPVPRRAERQQREGTRSSPVQAQEA